MKVHLNSAFEEAGCSSHSNRVYGNLRAIVSGPVNS
jgi:hypothetical protein